jgi:chromosomal replication initiation ATPase DnaA
MNASELWKSILSHLEQRLTEAEVTTWLRSLSPEFSGDTLVLSAPNIYAKKRIESDYRKQISELATALNGGELVVKVRTATAPSNTTRIKPANKRSRSSIQTKKKL